MVTLCRAERRPGLLRALESALSQEGITTIPIVIVNGNRYDPGLLGELRRRADVRVFYQQQASIIRARRLARENIESEFFSMIDDDDEYLPGAFRERLVPLIRDPSVDAVVSDGYVSEVDRVRKGFMDIEALRKDPLATLMRHNWLATASGMFRTMSVGPDYFDTTIRSMDMTYLAFRLAREKRVVFIEDATYRKNYSNDSVSLTAEWHLPEAATLGKMLGFPMPRHVRRLLRHKYTTALHVLSDYHRIRGNLLDAWAAHLRSLRGSGGLLRYGLYTRKLLPLPELLRGRLRA